VAERCALIDAEKANYSIVWMCQMLDGLRSSCYLWPHRVETPTAARRPELAEHIKRIFQMWRQT
jgi:putative transposase